MLPSHPFPHHGWERVAALGLGLQGGPDGREQVQRPGHGVSSWRCWVRGVCFQEGVGKMGEPAPSQGPTLGEKAPETGLWSVTLASHVHCLDLGFSP